MRPKCLVVTTVHWPDDTRIRERLIRSLQDDFVVTFACREPGPSDRSNLDVIELRGGRLMRNVRALGLGLRGSWDIMVIHDPETVPAALVTRLVRKKPVVFDVHENIPETALSRGWIPGVLRRPMKYALKLLMRLAERVLAITLAEPGYSALFRSDHPVFENYPDTSGYPDPVGTGDGTAIYLGDITAARGVDLAVEACREAGVPLTLVGRLSDELNTAGSGVSVLGPLPNPEAIRVVSRASVGLAPLRDIPNYRHSLPTKVLEYLATGIPVIASDLPGTRSLLSDLDGVFLVIPGDRGALVSALREAMSPAIRKSTIAQAGRVRSEFTWPSEAVRGFYRSFV